jgi:hypothetical protein
MNCPQCSRDVPGGTTCPYCGARLAPAAVALAPGLPADAAQSLPLTAGQRARLIADCAPVVFFVLALLFVLTWLDRIVGSHSPLLPLFLAFVALVTGYQAVQSLRDLISGVALVQRDKLERSWRSNGRGTSRRYGTFTALGRLELTSRAFDQARPGSQHLVVYSPASKIVWEARPDESYDQLRS